MGEVDALAGDCLEVLVLLLLLEGHVLKGSEGLPDFLREIGIVLDALELALVGEGVCGASLLQLVFLVLGIFIGQEGFLNGGHFELEALWEVGCITNNLRFLMRNLL